MWNFGISSFTKLLNQPSPEELAKQALENPNSMQLSDEVVAQIHDKFSGITIDEAKRVIFDVTNELVNELKVSTKTTLLLRLNLDPSQTFIQPFRRVN